jgi:hypothetical protein
MIPLMRFNVEPMGWNRPAVFALLLLALATCYPSFAQVSIQQTNDAIECRLDGQTLWRFFYSTNFAKPGFHPLQLLGGESLTALQPPDHKWHYGLWFSWKYINHVNYWEEKNGRPDGRTVWDQPKLKKESDGAALITMNLRYISPSNEVMMTEKREIRVSPPDKEGGVTIDWASKFKAGKTPLVLDRTPMPGEEHGAVNGGYAGLSVRAAQSPAVCEFVTAEGPVKKFESDRARPNSKAAACNITQNGRTDGLAIISDPHNLGGDSPWYMVNSKSMHWFSPVLLAPAPKKVKPHESFTWKFRIMTRAGARTPESLKAEVARYR